MLLVRGVRVFLPFVLVLAVVAGLVAVLSARPDITNAKRRVDSEWTTIAPLLTGHYEKLRTADNALITLPGPMRQLAGDVDAALQSWSSAHGVGAQVRAANNLEALGRRLVVAALSSSRVDNTTKSVVGSFESDPAPDPTAFNTAVHKYENERRGPLRQIVASLLGDDDIPAFTPALTT